MYQAPLHSMMLALEKITDDLLMRKQRGEDVRGNAVINMSLGYDDIGPVNEEHMPPLLERLFNDFQAVLVVAAGITMQRMKISKPMSIPLLLPNFQTSPSSVFEAWASWENVSRGLAVRLNKSRAPSG